MGGGMTLESTERRMRANGNLVKAALSVREKEKK